jgi:tRNA(Phe) wybutosine-synthesizing methylase Tyw3
MTTWWRETGTTSSCSGPVRSASEPAIQDAGAARYAVVIGEADVVAEVPDEMPTTEAVY